MIGLGTTLRSNSPPRHIWIVLSDPSATGGKILMVNMTSLTEHCIDDVCILDENDYELLTHKTTIAYSRRKRGNAGGLEKALALGEFVELPSLTPATLLKIIEGARRTRELSSADQALLPQN